jgi:hypothetical protein
MSFISTVVRSIRASREEKVPDINYYFHHPVDDAKGNAEAILEMQKMGLKINLEGK